MMLNVDIEPARVVVPDGVPSAKRIVMRQHWPAASLDCSFNTIHHNLSQYNCYYVYVIVYA